MTRKPSEVLALRGESIESRHRVSIALVDVTGRLVVASGDPDAPVFLRSAAKPFQAAAALAAGAIDPTDEELAVICASHSGEDDHVATVLRLLERLGLDAGSLRCGPHRPLDEKTAARVGAAFGPLHNNCSGKHAGMLALALRLGQPVDRYLDPDGPAQRRILETIAAVTGVSPDRVTGATDGCSAPTFAVPLRAAARAFALLGRPDTAPAELRQPLCRIATAMAAHPWHAAGSGRFDTALMEAAGERIVSKAGAEGVQGIADREGGLGFFLKVEDGAGRACPPATVATLRERGALPQTALEALASWERPILRNHAGIVVGRLEARLRLVH